MQRLFPFSFGLPGSAHFSAHAMRRFFPGFGWLPDDVLGVQVPKDKRPLWDSIHNLVDDHSANNMTHHDKNMVTSAYYLMGDDGLKLIQWIEKGKGVEFTIGGFGKK